MSSTAGSEQVPVFIRGNRGHWDALHGHPLAICFALAAAILIAGPLTAAMAGVPHASHNRSGATARAAGRRGHGRPIRPG